MKYTRNLKEITAQDIALAGGKGASLGELISAGFNVPNGFVIATDAYDEYIKNEKIISSGIENEIIDAFGKLGLVKVAVRSSATVEDGTENAWAGQLETYLNTTKENLLENVKKCWNSLSSARASAYRHEKGLDDHNISVAVVVQKMVEAESAGVAFSVHPVNEDTNQIVIEAVQGFGEKLVSGEVTPDKYIVTKIKLEIIENKGQHLLQDEQLKELADLIIKIEKHYGFPVDVEWAYADGEFYILQSRPITTLQKSKSIFEGIEMVLIGKRPANLYEASLKVMAWSQVWERELGVGYKVAIMNSLGEYFVDQESRDKVYDFFKTKNIVYAENYIKKLSHLRTRLLEEVKSNPLGDFTEGFTDMMAYFFIIKSISEMMYVQATSEQQKMIEYWRNDATIFDPLDLWYVSHPEKDQENLNEWSWVFSHGTLRLENRKITFVQEKKKMIEVETTESGTIQKITGSPAYPGIVRGKVRLIMSQKDKDLMQEGEVIVAPMTTVDFMPIMKKAIAFVTNEGGITSHAAIVAREMQKPCIIGTKIATEVLHTGDFIEVDADNGVVRILS